MLSPDQRQTLEELISYNEDEIRSWNSDNEYRQGLRDEIDALRAALTDCATLAARGARTCETCLCATAAYNDGLAGDDTEGWRGCRLIGNNVPLTIHGQPFGCAGWAAK